MMFAQDSPLVILDTSVFLSALLSKNPNSAPCQIIRYWREDRFKLVISPQLLEELVEKLLLKNIDRNDIKDILTAIFYTAINHHSQCPSTNWIKFSGGSQNK